MSIGDRIRDLRWDARLKQVELARRAGIAKNTMSQIELGHAVPSIPTLEKIARALGVDLSEMLVEEPGELFKDSALPKDEGRVERPDDWVLDTRVEHWGEWLSTYNRDRDTEEQTGVVVIPRTVSLTPLESRRVRLEADPVLKRAWPLLMKVMRQRIIRQLDELYVLYRADELLSTGMPDATEDDGETQETVRMFSAAVVLQREVLRLLLRDSRSASAEAADRAEEELARFADERVQELRRGLLRAVPEAV